MANQDDNNNQEIEKVEDVEVETTKNTSDTDNKLSLIHISEPTRRS